MTVTRSALRERTARPSPAERRPSGLSDRQLRVLVPVTVIVVAGLAIQIPRYNYNIAPSDLPIVLFIVLAAASFWRSRVRLRLPLAAGFLLMLVGGSLAVTQSVALRESTSALVQDVYLFAAFLLAVNLIARAPEKLARQIAVAWAIVGAVTGGFMWFVDLHCPSHIPVFMGWATSDQFCRVTGTLYDPNLAGYYLVISMFVAWASPRPRSRFWKLVLSVPMVLGIYATQSITALIVLVAGVVVTGVVGFVSRRQAAAAATLLVLAIAVASAAALPPDFKRDPAEVAQSIGSSDAFSGSLGRSQGSFQLRAARWKEAFRFFGGNILVGIGPAATSATLQAERAPIGGEIHNDYIGGFLERGITGGIGVLLIFGAAAAWAMRVAIDDRLRRRGWHPSAFAGVMLAILLTAITLETLHFRHLWMALALVIGLGLRQEGRSPADEAAGSGARVLVPGRRGRELRRRRR